jgi:hypothetical protein
MKSISKVQHQTLINWFFVFGIGLFAGGCSPSMNDYKNTVRDGIKTVPHVQEIKQMFPNAPTDHFITQYGFEKDKPVVWNTVVYFGGRYDFSYQVEVMVDYKKNRISKIVSKPKFVLWQVSRIYDASPQTIGAEYNGDYKFEEADWGKVVAAKGDFSLIGIQIVTNSPVPRFEEYVHGERKDRVQVEP